MLVSARHAVIVNNIIVRWYALKLFKIGYFCECASARNVDNISDLMKVIYIYRFVP